MILEIQTQIKLKCYLFMKRGNSVYCREKPRQQRKELKKSSTTYDTGSRKSNRVTLCGGPLLPLNTEPAQLFNLIRSTCLKSLSVGLCTQHFSARGDQSFPRHATWFSLSALVRLMREWANDCYQANEHLKVQILCLLSS